MKNVHAYYTFLLGQTPSNTNLLAALILNFVFALSEGLYCKWHPYNWKDFSSTSTKKMQFCFKIVITRCSFVIILNDLSFSCKTIPDVPSYDLHFALSTLIIAPWRSAFKIFKSILSSDLSFPTRSLMYCFQRLFIGTYNSYLFSFFGILKCRSCLYSLLPITES